MCRNLCKRVYIIYIEREFVKIYIKSKGNTKRCFSKVELNARLLNEKEPFQMFVIDLNGSSNAQKMQSNSFFFFFFSKQLVHSLSSEFNKRTSLQKQVHNLLGCGVGIKKEISLYTCIVFEFRVSTYVSQNMSSRPTHYPSHPILICS